MVETVRYTGDSYSKCALHQPECVHEVIGRRLSVHVPEAKVIPEREAAMKMYTWTITLAHSSPPDPLSKDS